MKYLRCLLSSWLILGFSSWLLAQKNDYIWLSGYDGNNTKMDFNQNSVQIIPDSLSINYGADNVSTSDNNGNLQFSTNAVYIFNSFDELIENGDSLNSGFVQYGYDLSIQQYGFNFPQGILAFQDITNPNYYYLIHTYVDSVEGTEVSEFYSPKILMTLVDMSVNNGNIIFKNRIVAEGNFGFELAATHHGNGRDWWLIVQNRNSNCYSRILIDTTGPHVLPDITCGDSAIFSVTQDHGSATFSPDGSKYIYFTIMKGLKIFDFDRCTGELSNPVQINIDIWDDSSWLGNGVAISPSNRFLYLSATHYLVQYDLQAANIALSADTIGIYDGYKLPFGSLFNTAQAGPDGKIYISCGNAEADYHVINNPDAKGDSCNFVQHGILLTSYSAGVPNYPNYRLGRSVGSVCDTLYTNVDEVILENRERILKVFPNPATDIITIDYGLTNWSAQGVISLEIVNELGENIYSQIVPQYSGYQRIDISKCATGIYTSYIKRNEQMVATQKFAKE